MASSTSYLNTHRVTLISSYSDRALFVAHECLVVIMSDLGCDDHILLYFISRSNLLWSVSDYQRFSLIYA
jgi:hypothetical protein